MQEGKVKSNTKGAFEETAEGGMCVVLSLALWRYREEPTSPTDEQGGFDRPAMSDLEVISTWKSLPMEGECRGQKAQGTKGQQLIHM